MWRKARSCVGDQIVIPVADNRQLLGIPTFL